MKFAFYPGCVARGAGPELFDSAVAVMDRLGIEWVELTGASCTGAGVLQEKDQKLGDILNIRTLAMAEQLGLPVLTICSTCQGVMAQADRRVRRNAEYLEEINGYLAEEGLSYSGDTTVKHLLWVLVEDIGVETLKKTFVKELSGVNLAPFYGCYIVRPSDALGFDENPERQTSLETVIEAVGGNVIDFPGKTACCGFPILLINQRNSLRMVANHTGTASELGADAMVTPCPLCHLNLDGYQPKARRQNNRGKADLPIIHLPQLLGLAMGMDAKELGLGKHLVGTKDIVRKVDSIPVAS